MGIRTEIFTDFSTDSKQKSEIFGQVLQSFLYENILVDFLFHI